MEVESQFLQKAKVYQKSWSDEFERERASMTESRKDRDSMSVIFDNMRGELQRSLEAVADTRKESERLKGENDRIKCQVDALLQRARNEVPNTQPAEHTERNRWEPRCPQTVTFQPPTLFSVRDPGLVPEAQFSEQHQGEAPDDRQQQNGSLEKQENLRS